MLWEKTLIWGNQTAYKWQAELATMGVSAEHQIHTAVYIGLKQFWSMGEQDGVAVFTFQQTI